MSGTTVRTRSTTAALVAVGVLVAVVAGLVVGLVTARRDRPSFPSLQEQPDPTLRGTVAYLDGPSRCVWIVAAAGRPSRRVLCLPPMDVAKAVELGAKETDPQLRWLADGRLEITVFRAAMRKGEPPEFLAGWQKLVDVRTGAIEDVPAGDVPATPDVTTRPTLSPDGRRIGVRSDPASGRVEVTLTQDGRTRTLLKAQGPAKYTYGLQAAFWAPDWRWVAADDGRILVITTGREPTTRVLVDPGGGGGGLTDDGHFASFAVTATDVLSAEARTGAGG